MYFIDFFLVLPYSNDVICFCPSQYLASSGMFAHIHVRFGSSKGVLPRELENDVAYSSNLVGAWHLSIHVYTLAQSHRERDEENEKMSVEAESLREKVEYGRRAWEEGPLDFVSVDKR